MRTLSSIRPRLANDAIFLPSKRGVFFRNDGNRFMLEDEGTYELMRRIAPELNGRQELDDICRRLEPEVRERIVTLVGLLMDRGILCHEDGRHRAGQLPEIIETQFASPLALLQHLTDRSDERFASFRASTVLLAGSGLSFWSCAAALIRNGLERLWLLDIERTNEGSALVAAEVEALRAVGIHAEVRPAVVTPDLALIEPHHATLMLHVADAVSLPDVVRISRWALRPRASVLSACVVDNQALMGPMVQAPGCLVCALTNMVEELCDPAQLDCFGHAIAEGGGRLERSSGSATSLTKRLGGDVAFEAFKMLAGHIRPDIERGLVLQTHEACEAVRAVFVPYALHGCLGWCERYASSDVPASTRARFEPIRPLFRPRGEATPC